MPDLLDLLPPTFDLPPDTHRAVDAAGIDDWWASCAAVAIRYLASLDAPFAADEVRELGVPEPRTANHWGSAFRRAQADGVIRQIGARPSTTGSRRGGLVRVWQGVAA